MRVCVCVFLGGDIYIYIHTVDGNLCAVSS